MRTKDEGDYREKTILFFSCRPTGCITVGCDVNLVQCFDIFRKHPDYYRAILESLTGRVDNIQQSRNEEGPVALAAGYAQSDENPDQEIADTQRRADEQMYQDKMKIKRSQEKWNTVENGH